MGRVLAAALATIAGSFAFAQQPIQSESKLVLVDSVVTRKGDYVTDLAQKDFKIYEDGKEQAVSAFSYQGSQAGQKHYIVLLFDDFSIAPANQHIARQAAANLIDANASPEHVVAIMDYARSLRITQNFTADAETLKQALSQSRPATTAEPLAAGGRAGRAGLAGQYSVDSRIEISALHEAARSLEPLAGRKTLIFFSGGFGATPEELNTLTNSFSEADIAIYPIDLGIHQGAGLTTGDLTSGMDVANPASFGAAGAAGGAGGGGGGGGRRGGGGGGADGTEIRAPVDVLNALAAATGGYNTTRANDLPVTLRKIAEEQGSYYSLGYIPSKDSKAGACHTLKVKVDRGGTSVRARARYCAPR